MILFYRHDGRSEVPRATLPPEAVIRIWYPDAQGFPPRGSRGLRNIMWWVSTRLGLFARRGFAEITIWRDGRMLHRLIVTPRWYRFPFMTRNDLQLGDLWTSPAARGQGLARAAIGEVHRRFADGTGHFWYVVESDNGASIRLAETCGYRLAGIGRRTRPLGLRTIGRFRLDMPVS
jgi:RimJ/RimL family protein N-acetyltransferase